MPEPLLIFEHSRLHFSFHELTPRHSMADFHFVANVVHFNDEQIEVNSLD